MLLWALRQLMLLWELLEMSKRDNEIFNQRLDSELKMQRKLQQDLHSSCSAEAKMLRSVAPVGSGTVGMEG